MSNLVRTVVPAVIFAGLAVGCSGPARSVQPDSLDKKPVVLLISIDGFRWDYLDIHDAPNLNALAKNGVRSMGLVPVFPTLTFPNHYTVVTGLYPAQHGIVSNRFYDGELDRSFTYSNPEDAADSTWWGGEPIWITARKHGLSAAVYFWPGSETVVDGLRPNHWHPYDGSVPGAARVDQALRWLDLREGIRPSFIALYFSNVDQMSHDHGPESAETGEAVGTVDSLVGRLVDGLSKRNLLERINIILVSDHGQAEKSPERVIYLEDYIDVSKIRFVEYGATTSMWPTEVEVPDLYSRLHQAHPHLSVFTRNSLPERWRYEGSSRIPSLIAVADEGWSFGRRTNDNPAWHTGGDHGYDPAVKAMHGLFVAHGPAFKRGALIGEVETVHLYALMSDILGIDAAPNQGSLSATRDARSVTQLSR